jgi:hypothetical protein
MQSHGSAAFAILPLIIFLFLQFGWKLAPCLIIFRNIMLFIISFVALQIPWSLWQKLGDPPGDRLIKWHIGGVVAVDARSTTKLILESYKSLTPERFLQNKWANIRTIVTPGGLPPSPWLSLEDRSQCIELDFFGLVPAISWALPSFFALTIIWFYNSRSRKTCSSVMNQFCPCLSWVIATLIVWVFLMFIPGSTVNHQGPMNLSLICLLLCGAALSSQSSNIWRFTTVLQGAAVLWIYLGHPLNNITASMWSFLAIGLVAVMITVASFPKSELRNNSLFK